MSDDMRNVIRSRRIDAAIQVGVLHGNINVAGPTIPRQLPMAPRWHVARERQLSTLTTGLTDARLPAVVIEGIGGVGKTTLALHWAHQNATRFPDGQLFTNLRGFDPHAAPAKPGTVLHGFLLALGVDPAAVPAEVDAAAALYRSVLAGRRIMIVLDNARDVDQVLPLLPGTASCAVLVTTRNRLSWLRTQGVFIVRLETMADADAQALLDHVLSSEAVLAEPAAVTAIVRRCGGLPLALTIAAARVTEHPDFPMSALVEELDEEGTRLNAFDAGDGANSLSAVLSWSSGSLGAEPARAFRLLGATPLVEIGVSATACLLAVPPRDAAGTLRALETANLVRQHRPGRFQMHDLVRLHAAELAAGDETRAALRRLVGSYAHTARIADILLYPHRYACAPPELPEGCHPVPLADDPAAVAWFDDELPALLVLHQAARCERWQEAVWHIAHGLDTYQYRLGLLAENIAASRLGLEAAEAIGSARLRASALRQLGRAHTRAGDLAEAESCLREALRIEEDVGFVMGQAHAHHDLQRVHSLAGRHVQALSHARSALRLYRAERNPVGAAHALNAQGWQHAQLSDFALARECCEQALGLHAAHGNVSGQAATCDALGHIARRAGQLDQAAEHYAAAVHHTRQLGNRFAEADHVERLAVVLAEKGEHDAARTMLRTAHELFAAQHRLADAERVLNRLTDSRKP
jgi:tetratricopeptide (TPR) repeat protein